jgi:hypothetical protein
VGRQTIAGGVPVSTRFSGQKRTIDLAPYLGDNGSVRTAKSVRTAAGTFTIELTDQIQIDAQDSLYGLVEPMDVVEIRMTGDAYKYATIPIMMRGFVSNVRRVQVMTPQGPQRRVIIAGHDYGKIWQILQIFYMPNIPTTSNLITSFPFFAQYGVTFNIQLMATFVSDVINQVLNPYILNMGDISGQADTSPLLQLAQDIQVISGKISPFGIGAFEGSIYTLLTQFGDVNGWNELFIEDREDAPYVVYRPNPFRLADSSGFIPSLGVNEQLAPAVIDIDLSHVIAYDVMRSDDHVANYYWVDAPRFTLSYTDTIRAFAYFGDPNSFYVQNYGNVDPRLYGVRKMSTETQQGGDQETDNGNGSPAGVSRDDNQKEFLGWMSERRQQLIDQNQDNVVFEDGSFRLRGNEKIRAGTYLRLTHGNMRSYYYVVAASHDYRPFVEYTTTVQVERGTGFIDRSQRGSGANSPYWGEIVQK